MRHEPDTDVGNASAANAGMAPSAMRGSPAHVSDVYPDAHFVVPALVFGAAMVVLFVRFGLPWYWIALVLVGALSAAGALQWKAFLEVDKKAVREEGRLFGGRLLKTRMTPLAEFEAIVFRHDTGESEEWLVGIRHRSGRKIWMRRYLWNDPIHPAPGHAAEGFALRLSRETRLEIEDYHPQSLKQWLRSSFARQSQHHPP